MHRAVDAIWRWQEQICFIFSFNCCNTQTKETLAALNLYLELIANFSLKGTTNWCPALEGPFSYLYARWQCFLPCILQHIENKVSKKRFYDWNKKGKWGKKRKRAGDHGSLQSEQRTAEGRDQVGHAVITLLDRFQLLLISMVCEWDKAL